MVGAWLVHVWPIYVFMCCDCWFMCVFVRDIQGLVGVCSKLCVYSLRLIFSDLVQA